MILETLNSLFQRDLTKLEKEITMYDDETRLWLVSAEITNCAGNLCAHITGNLRHFIGAVLGKTDYVRDRHAELNAKGIARSQLLADIQETRDILDLVLPAMTESALQERYPIDVFKREMTTEFFLVHLYGHMNYHLGQVNYHRRLLAV